MSLLTYKNRDIVPTPEDKDEFEQAVQNAVRELYRSGTRVIHIYSIYSVTRWQRTPGTSHRIGYAIRKFGLVKIAKPNNPDIYRIPAEAVA